MAAASTAAGSLLSRTIDNNLSSFSLIGTAPFIAIIEHTFYNGNTPKEFSCKKEGLTMGSRFRKSVKLAPGVKLNLGKKSAGISIGGKHGGININSKTGASSRVSVPGTGISYTSNLSSKKKKTTSAPTPHTVPDDYMSQEGLSKTKTDLIKNRWLFFFVFVIFFFTGLLALFLKWALLGIIEIVVAIISAIVAYKGFAYHQETD